MNSLKFYTENYTITMQFEKKSQNWIIHPPPPPQSISQVEELRENEDLTPLHSDCCHAEQPPLMQQLL